MSIGRPVCGALAVLAMASSACAGDLPFATKEITAYPFVASPERAAAIRGAYQRVVAGMSREEATAILGEPEEIHPTYEPKVWGAKLIGYSHWYVIRRLVGRGSANDKQEALVRVSYGFDHRVVRVDAWGL